MHIEQAVEIAAEPERVWSFIEDPEKTTRWMDELVENELTGGESVTLGSTFRMKIKEGSRLGEYRAQVVEHDPPRRFKLEMTGASLGEGTMVVEYRLADLGSRTRVEYVSTLQMKGLLLRLLGPLLARMGRKRVGRHLAKLKALAEAG